MASPMSAGFELFVVVALVWVAFLLLRILDALRDIAYRAEWLQDRWLESDDDDPDPGEEAPIDETNVVDLHAKRNVA